MTASPGTAPVGITAGLIGRTPALDPERTYSASVFPFRWKPAAEHAMSFPWPVDEPTLNSALDIAMRYIDLPPDEEQYASVESFAGQAIMVHWRRGVRNDVILANKAIAEVEKDHPLGKKLQAS